MYILSISQLSYPLLGFVSRWVVSCLTISFQFIPRLNSVSDDFNDWVSLGYETWIKSAFILHLWILCPLKKNLLVVPHWRHILFPQQCCYNTPLKFIPNNKWWSLYLRNLFCSWISLWMTNDNLFSRSLSVPNEAINTSSYPSSNGYLSEKFPSEKFEDQHINFPFIKW